MGVDLDQPQRLWASRCRRNGTRHAGGTDDPVHRAPRHSDTRLDVPSVFVRADDDVVRLRLRGSQRRTAAAARRAGPAHRGRADGRRRAPRPDPAPHRRGHHARRSTSTRCSASPSTRSRTSPVTRSRASICLVAGWLDPCTCAAIGTCVRGCARSTPPCRSARASSAGWPRPARPCTGRIVSESADLLPAARAARHAGRDPRLRVRADQQPRAHPRRAVRSAAGRGGVRRRRDRARRSVREPDRPGPAERPAPPATRRQLDGSSNPPRRS